MGIQLSRADTELLIDVLETYLRDFRMEVARTEQADYRHSLEDRAERIEHLLASLSDALAAVPATSTAAEGAVGTAGG
jgi:hypothetical protein